METLMADIRYGLRMLLRSPGFLAAATITLALGIGANTAIFSLIDGLLLRPLPIHEPLRLTMLAAQRQGGTLRPEMSVPEYREIREQTTSVFSDVAAHQIGLDGMAVNGKGERILTDYVSGNFFQTMGIQPQLGRFVEPADDAAPGVGPVIVLSDKYWKSRFGADPNVVGRSVSLNGHPFTIIGVAPKGFAGVNAVISAQGFLPLGMIGIEFPAPDYLTNRQNRSLQLLARLQPETTLEQARSALNVIAAHWAQDHPDSEKGASVQAYLEIRSRPQPDPNNTVLILSTLFLGLAGLVLLLACLNVANLLLVRASARGREMAIRSALGAGRGRLIRQLLVESLLLAALGGIGGLALGYFGSVAFAHINLNVDLPLNFDFGFDWRVFAYASFAALATGLVVGLVPALRASHGNLNTILHEGGRGVVGGKNRLRTSLVVAQVAGSLVILIIAGLFSRSLAQAQHITLGFETDHVVNFMMDPVEIGYSQQQTTSFYKELLDRVGAVPGVVSVSIANGAPMGYYNNAEPISVEGYTPPPSQGVNNIFYASVTPDYFRTMQIKLDRGRVFAANDDQNAQMVAVISEAMAREYWPNADAMGRRFSMVSDIAHPMTVVGVAADIRYQGVSGAYRPMYYIPYLQHTAGNSLQILQVRTAGAPDSMIPVVEHIIDSLAPQLAVFDVKTMRQAIYTLNGLLLYQVGAALAAMLGILGLILAIVGVYGVVSYAAAQKTHEIGVRMALGAQPRDILQMVLREGVLIVGVGLLVGIALTFMAGSVVGTFTVVSGRDPATYVTVTAILAAVAFAACLIPAWRSTRVDPLVALRYE
ncbi:MAG TPA: ABC transporter permease [Candidatus Acidoferrales bacterium]